MAATEAPIESLADLIDRSKRLFVLTGAGVSTESGIPDFRGPDGLWTRNPAAARMFDLDAYVADPEVRRAAWRVRRDGPIPTARPNEGHAAIAQWEPWVTLSTQNIDGLHQRAGSADVLELHGTFWQTMCLSCDDRRAIGETFDRLDAGDDDPRCLRCGGLLKTATVAFGQQLDPDVLARSVTAAKECDLAVAIGSSLSVQPAASLVGVAVETGSPLVIVNAQPTTYDSMAATIIRDPIGPSLTKVNALARRVA